MIGQARTLAALQGDVTGMLPSLETIDDVGEARTAFGEVRRIDLCDVAKADHLGTRSGARYQGLHLLWRQVLRLVEDQVARQEGAAAHEVHRTDLDPRVWLLWMAQDGQTEVRRRSLSQLSLMLDQYVMRELRLLLNREREPEIAQQIRKILVAP